MSKAAGQRNANQREKDTSGTRDKKEQIYSEARRQAETAVKEGVSAIEDARARITALKSQEMSFEKQLAVYEPAFEAQDRAFEALMALYPKMTEDIGVRRAERLDAASKMNQTNPKKREASLHQISRHARRQLEETNQRANDATDATNLIKSIKAAIRFR